MHLVEHRLQVRLANGTVQHGQGLKIKPEYYCDEYKDIMSATLLWLLHRRKPEPSSANCFGRKLSIKSATGNVRSQTNQQLCGRSPRRDQVLSPWRFDWQPKRRILVLMRAFLKIQSKPSSVGSARYSSSSPSHDCGWCHQQNLSLDVLLLKSSLNHSSFDPPRESLLC